MSELTQLISQQVSLLKEQNKLQQNCIDGQKIYIEQLEKRSAALLQQMKEEPPVDFLNESIKGFSKQTQAYLEKTLTSALRESNIDQLVQDKINQQIQPMLKDIQDTQSKLTQTLSQISTASSLLNTTEVSERLTTLEDSLRDLTTQLKKAIEY
ncbi:hypothetical protein SDC9_63253 [bioreactor metagenome]|uniref:Uncharacterized protein n=1 Tax=bioreactor metagenome TaxID=1076179 RepID=A0A644XM28_9ZZZZ